MRLLVVAGVLVVGSAVGAVAAFPEVGAVSCPGCYRFDRLGPNIYVEHGTSAGQRQRVAAVVAEGGRRVGDFFEGPVSRPRILACPSEICYRRIGGGRDRGRAVLYRAVILSPRGVNPVIAAHELTHVELHARLGSASGQVPSWFDEGLAVTVSDDPRHLAPKTAPDRCLVDTQQPLPRTLEEWLRTSGTDKQLYAKSACRVSRWLKANGGQKAVPTLIKRLHTGEEFSEVVPT